MSMVFAQVYVLMLEPRYLLDWLGPIIESIPYDKIRKLLTCSTCMAGQISLWSFPFFADYHFLVHIGTVSITIWLTHMTNKIFYD